MTFKTLGGGTFDLTDTQIEAWQLAYKGVDVAEECAKAHAWILANPSRAKKSIPRFLVNWLNRAATTARLARQDGAYREPKGARPQADTTYADAYWKARSDGYSNMAAARIAQAAVDSAK